MFVIGDAMQLPAERHMRRSCPAVSFGHGRVAAGGSHVSPSTRSRGARLDASPPGLGRIDECIFDGADPTNGYDCRVGMSANDAVVVRRSSDTVNKASSRNWHAR